MTDFPISEWNKLTKRQKARVGLLVCYFNFKSMRRKGISLKLSLMCMSMVAYQIIVLNQSDILYFEIA
jgi:hypothetical protein